MISWGVTEMLVNAIQNSAVPIRFVVSLADFAQFVLFALVSLFLALRFRTPSLFCPSRFWHSPIIAEQHAVGALKAAKLGKGRAARSRGNVHKSPRNPKDSS
jgi:hypothetical protein